MEIPIRVATMADVPTLRDLIPLSARELSKNYYTPQQVESAITYIFGVDTQLISDGTYYVAEADGQIVGCGGWSKRKTMFGGDQMKEAQNPMLHPAQDAGRIRAFFIHPQWARKGIGRGIIHACEAAAQADGFSRMELVATMPGEPLYAAMGYTVSRRFDQPMADGTSLPIAHMQKQLPLTITIARERPDAPAAISLITELEALLEPLYPAASRHGFSVDKLLAEDVPFFVLRANGTPAACGGIKLVGGDYGEIKRMYVRPLFRGLGFAKLILDHLANYASAHNITLLRLETGVYQREAIALYERLGFYRILPFGPYFDDPLSLCYEKQFA